MQKKKVSNKNTTSTKKTAKKNTTRKKVNLISKSNISSKNRVTSGRKKSNNKKKKIDLKRKVLILGSIIFVVLLIVIGNCYALVSTYVKVKKLNLIRTANYDVIFEDGSEFINLENEGPESDEEGLKNSSYKFTITNDSKLSFENKIYFSDIESSIPTEYLKIAIKENDIFIVNAKTLEEVGDIIRNSLVLEPGQSISYEIILWISDQADNSVMGTSYKSKITVESNQTSN